MHDIVADAQPDVASELIQPTCRGGLASVKKTLDIPRLQDMSCKSHAREKMFHWCVHHAQETTNRLEDLCSHQQIWATVLSERINPVQKLHQVFQCLYGCFFFGVPACAQRYRAAKAIASF